MTQDKAYERLESARQRIADQSEVTGHMITAVKEGKALADDGNTYNSVQDAVDAASSFVKVGPGTFSEDIVLPSREMEIVGSGPNGTTISATNTAFDSFTNPTTIRNLEIFAGASGAIGIQKENSGSDNITVSNVTFSGDNTGDRPVANHIVGFDNTYTNCVFQNWNSRIELGERTVFANNTVDNCDNRGVYTGSDDIVANNVVINTGTDTNHGAITVWADDNIVISNRIHNSGGDGIYINEIDNIIANNRISDSGASDIQNDGGGTVLDGNLTGASN